MEYIWGIDKFERYRIFISKDDQDDMVQEILTAVKSLGIYRIHYSSLLYISKELALQPPHPWFVEKAFDYNAIRYDFDKAMSHCKNMKYHFSNKDYESCLYAFRETIHHTCSAILAYYGIFMGCGYLSPVHTLQRVISNIESQKCGEILSRHDINLKVDLRGKGISIIDFSRNIKLLREQLQITSSGGQLKHKEIEIAINQASCVFEICKRLLSSFLDIYELSNTKKTINNEMSLVRLAEDIFHVIPGFETRKDKKGRIWIIHNLDRPIFTDIKNRILLAPIYIADSRVTPSYLEKWSSIINPLISNTIFFVSNSDYTENSIEFSETLRSKGILGLLFKLDKLINIALSDDPLSELELHLF